MNQRVFLGPPGTGKTTTLLRLVEELFDQGYDPREIGFVSFTRKAAYEARDRALDIFPTIDSKELGSWATLHSIAFRKLHLARHDVMQRENWMEISKKTGFPMAGYYNADDGQLAGGTLEGDKYLFHYGLAHARIQGIAEYHGKLPFYDRTQTDLKKLSYFVDTLNLYKQETGLLDFNDMIEQATMTGELGVKVAIIDEAQDLSKRQWMLVRSLFENCEQVIIAGDDDQSIYEWSGADVDMFLNLKGEKTVLDRSYRLPRSIYEFANRIVGRVQNRIPKNWQPDDREGSVKFEANFQNLREKVSVNDGQSWLILARNRYLLNERIADLRAWGVPYAEKGRSAVKDEDLRAIKAYEAARSGKPLAPAHAQAFYNKLKGSVDIQRGFKQLPDSAPEAIDWNWLVANGGLKVDRDKPWFDALQIDDKDKAYYRAIRRHGYSTEDVKVNCSTIHSVKGGEADNVVLIDAMAKRTHNEMNENPDAEHRVQYVGATRARENLFVLQTGSPTYYDFAAA